MKTHLKHFHPQDVYTCVLGHETFGENTHPDILAATRDKDAAEQGVEFQTMIALGIDKAFDSGDIPDLEGALTQLELGARSGNRFCAAVLGAAILFLYNRRQVVADGLSWLARAASEGVVDANYALLRWYSRRWNAKDMRNYQDVDVGLDSCYEPTPKCPPVPFPTDSHDCLRQAWLWALRGTAAGSRACAAKLAGFELPPDILFADPELLDLAAATGETTARLVAAQYHFRNRASCSERKKAVQEFRELAEGGNACAAYLLAMTSQTGAGITPEESVRWFEVAAEAGFPNAMLALGCMYQTGTNVPKDEEKSADWHRRGAEAGQLVCCFHHGVNLLAAASSSSKNLRNDLREASRWIRRAAEEGNVAAAWAFMADMYTTGIGLYVNKKKAAECRKRAEALGWRRDSNTPPPSPPSP